MITPEIFLEWLRYAIGRVGPGYFGFVERVYCYELYHFLRVAMYGYERRHGPIQNVYLHSEFVKVVITDEEARRYEVFPLGNRRSPDFMLHEPNTTERVFKILCQPNSLTSQTDVFLQALWEVDRQL
ncbi:hypothetical protein, partial [Microbulbifer thermotolerans]|uniref:hypothetical protein n=1 Tax=Microbulbifer thermotolerans TaxID=252514 RepID=UPI00224ACC79